MKIESSTVQLSARHSRVQEYSLSERLELWSGGTMAADETRVSERGRALQQQEAAAPGEIAADEEEQLPPQLHMMKQLIEYLTGRPIQLFRFTPSSDKALDLPAQAGNEAARAQAPAAAGWGVNYQRRESYTDTQVVSFEAEGSVRTADGGEFSFRATLLLASQYHETSEQTLLAGDAARRRKDPLVINYAGASAQLQQALIDFDIDADGRRESLQRLAAGSAYLALDRNGDEQINDGSELFGTRSGDGFADLAALDMDSNGWLDENDAAYGQLRLWLQDGTDSTLLNLKEADVGAIFTGRVASPFQLGENPALAGGELVSSGVFLKDSGAVGTVQQIDLYV